MGFPGQGQTQAPTQPAPQGGGPNVFNQSAGAYNAALGGTNQAMNFQPQQVGAFGYDAATAGQNGGATYNPAMAESSGYSGASMSGVDPITAQTVQAGQIAGTDLSPYTNPFENQVVGQTLNDIERARQIQQTQLSAQATAAGAFGGSRQGIAEAETNRAFADQSARSASGLRQAGFAQAQGLAGQDIAGRMQAALANQGANLSAQGQTANNSLMAQQANMNSQNQANQFSAGAANNAAFQNQNASNQAGQFGADTANRFASQNQNALNQAGQFNSGAMNNAAFQNQQANINANSQRMNAANQMGSLANLGFGFGNQISGTQQSQGGMQQGLQQMLIDAARGQYGGFTGAPTTALQTNIAATGAANMGQNTQTANKNPGLFDYLSLGAGLGSGG